MNQPLLRFCLLSLAISIGSSVFAQNMPYIFTARPKYTFTAGLKIRSSGATVKFGNLGTVPFDAIQYLQDSTGAFVKDSNGNRVPVGNYFFHDGEVIADSQRAEESNDEVIAGRTVFSADGRRYTRYSITQVPVLDSDGNQVKGPDDQPVTTTVTTLLGDFLAYQAGVTRNWSYENSSQVEGDSIAMHAYSARSEGAIQEAKAGTSGGFDLQLARDFGYIGKRFSWGGIFSFGLNEINASSSGTVKSTLVVQTGRFGLNGQAAPTPPYSAPSTQDWTPLNPDGTPIPDPADPTHPQVIANGYENTTTLKSTPTLSTSEQAGAAQVDGLWKVKGAYYLARLGPAFRYQITKRISVSGSAGVAAGYVGSTYTMVERLLFPANAPILSTTSTPITAPSISGEVRNRAFKTGFYGEVNAEFWFSYRTGFFAGITFENLGRYEQNIGGRTASVNIGSGTTFRVGVITRF